MNYVLPTGYLDLDNDCTYNIDLKSTRSRERIDPATDLAHNFNEYIKPRYGLGNINVANCASFMKELDMNWTKLDTPTQTKVMDILVSAIITPTSPFAKALQEYLNKIMPPPQVAQTKSSFGSKTNPIVDFFSSPLGLVMLIVIGGFIIVAYTKKIF
jgi:hypothetical protein